MLTGTTARFTFILCTFLKHERTGIWQNIEVKKPINLSFLKSMEADHSGRAV
jgi:hypothetical protein